VRPPRKGHRHRSDGYSMDPERGTIEFRVPRESADGFVNNKRVSRLSFSAHLSIFVIAIVSVISSLCWLPVYLSLLLIKWLNRKHTSSSLMACLTNKLRKNKVPSCYGNVTTTQLNLLQCLSPSTFNPMFALLTVFDKLARPLVMNVLNGYNGTVFACKSIICYVDDQRDDVNGIDDWYRWSNRFR
jgi:hypothetical protein